MNVSQEIAKDLYELSEWDDRDSDAPEAMQWYMGHRDESDYEIAPMYDLGFLMRKLPDYTHIWVDNTHHFAWAQSDTPRMTETSSTPEDATAKLCIDLIKNGSIVIEGM